MRSHPLMFLLDLPEGTLTAAFPAQGKGSIDVSNNFLDRQEIGYYEAELHPGAYAELRRLYEGIDFRTDPEVLEVPPDTKTLSVGEMVNEELRLRSFTLASVPPKVEPLLDAMRRILGELLKSPLRVLGGEGAASESRFATEQPVAFYAALRNRGAQPIELQSPFVPRGPDDVCNLRLIIARDKPPQMLRDDELLRLELTAGSVHPPDGERAPAERVLSLKPGEALRFVVRKKLLSTPGRYRAALTYTTTRGKRGLAAMEGALTIDLGTFEVLPPPTGKRL